MSGDPWSKFFWSDYEADEGLRFCSLAAQGLWMRMLCLMARATPKGELRIAAEPCSVSDLARSVGESEETVGALLDELRRRGVFSVTRAGVIFSRRLRKDGIISRKRAESGAKGAAVTNGKHEQISGLPQQKSGKRSGKRAAPEARSQKLEEPPNPLGGNEGVDLPDWIPGEAWAGFEDMRKRIKEPLTPRARTLAIGKLDELRQAGCDPGAVLDQSVLNNWKGLFKLSRRDDHSKGFSNGAASGSSDFLDHKIAERREREEWERQREAAK